MQRTNAKKVSIGILVIVVPALLAPNGFCLPPGGAIPKTGGGQEPTAPKPASTNKSSSAKPIQEHFLDIGPYLVKMQKAISANWKQPKEIKKVILKWQVLPNGNISGLRVDRSSSDPANDKAALDSVALSAPFDPLPKGMASLPMQYTFENVIRSGMDQIPVSEQYASINLSNLAVSQVEKKQLDEALDSLDFAFERDPKNPNIANVLRHIAAYVNDDTPDKMRLLYRVLALDPQQHAAIEKLRVLHRANQVDPDSVSARMELGDKALANWDAETALVEYSAANAIKAGSCPQEKFVDAYRIMAGYRMARKWQTIAKIRKGTECLCGLGRSYQLAGNYAESEKNYKEALELDPSSDMAKYLIGKLEEEKRTGVKEKIDTRMADHNIGDSGKSDLIPRAHLLNDEAIADLKSENYPDAIEKLKKAFEADPMSPDIKQNLSMAYNNLGTTLPPEEAVVCYRKALFVFQDNKQAHTNLSSYIKHKGKNPESFDDRLKLADDFAGSGDLVSAVVEMREALLRKKDPGVQARLKELIKKAPALP